VVTKKDSFESRRLEFRDDSLPGYEFGRRIEFILVFGIGNCRIMASKELGGAKKASCVI
jgi:hypothetical protein